MLQWPSGSVSVPRDSARKEKATGCPGAAVPHTCTGRSRWTTIWLERTLGKVTCGEQATEESKRKAETSEMRTEASRCGVGPKFENALALTFFGKRTLTERSRIRQMSGASLWLG